MMAYKIGFSDIGGIYVGKNIQSNFHRHYAITLIISFNRPFTISSENFPKTKARCVVIQKNINYQLQTSSKEPTAFIHISPFSDLGIKLNHDTPIRIINKGVLEEFLEKVKQWFNSTDSNTENLKEILNTLENISEITQDKDDVIDERIKTSLKFITEEENIDAIRLKDIATKICLSESRFAHLFKKETQMTFRQFVLHTKLIKSIYSLYLQNNLTESAFLGGFSDQAHFSRTFKNAFGVKPSSTKK